MAPKCHLLHVTKDYPFMTCVVKVHARSSWQKTVREVLNKCHGVNSFRMDENGVIEISGKVDPKLLLKMLEKAGSKAEVRWFQFGECSSNLFVPINQDGRFLQAANLSRPNPPSHHQPLGPSSARNPPSHHQALGPSSAHKPPSHHQALGPSSAHNRKHDDQFPYNHYHRHDYDQYAYHHYKHPYHYEHYDQSHEHDYQYNYGQMRNGNQTHYRRTTLAGEDVDCCRVM